jgi:hypothetical protein
MFYGWRPHVPVATRRLLALREMEKLRRKGHAVAPVVIQGRTIAKTFWGRSWCQNLEGYSDFANRLPRGRTYVRNGSVVDLQIAAGRIDARVAGSTLYTVLVQVAPLPKVRWSTLCRECAGSIDSLVELLAGRFSNGVMDRVCRQRTGLFPSPSEIEARVQLSRLGHDVQARSRRPLRDRRPPRREAGPALHAAPRLCPGPDRQGRRRPDDLSEGPGGREVSAG